MKKTHRHVHDTSRVGQRAYFGEADAVAILEWLNSAERKKGDTVERLIRAGAELRSGRGYAAMQEIRSILARFRLEKPSFHQPMILGPARRARPPFEPLIRPVVDRSRWVIEWSPAAPGMSRAQSLALFQVLEVAKRGLLERIRECEKKDCDLWFYARFKHQRFHSKHCQEETFRSDPEHKLKRAERMKQLRQEKKQLQEHRKQLRAARRRERWR